MIPLNTALRNGIPAPHGVPVSIDFETRAIVDLKVVGSRRYAQDPHTDVLCLCVKIGPAEDVWVPGHPIPPILADAIERGELIAAWNASFEIAIWQEIMAPRYGWPDLSVDRFTCTMQRAALVGCPGALERAAVALGLPARKDMDGHRLMLKMCKPLPVRKDEPGLRWHDDPEDHLRLQAYCMDDCRAEVMAAAALPAPPPMEVAVMRVDRYINVRGVRVDKLAAMGAAKIARIEKARLNGRMKQITNGRIGSTNQVAVILDFIRERGVEIDRLRAADVRDILADAEEVDKSGDLDVTDEMVAGYGSMDPVAREVLTLRAEASKASTAKLDALVNGTTHDGRMIDLFAYGAAYRTQRWAGRRFQAHNLPRANPYCAMEDTELWYETLATGDYDAFRDLVPPDKTIMDALKASLRGFVMASPGRMLMAADLNQIEARAAAWIAGQWDIIDAFVALDKAVAAGADEATLKNLDIYTVNGRKMGVDRQGGKIGTLACGYQGGKHALLVFANAYGMKMTEEKAEEIVDAWRNANPMIVRQWAVEDKAARAAILNPGTIYSAGSTGSYCVVGGNLMRKLPSGRVLVYRKIRVEPMPTPWGQTRQTITYEGNVFAAGRPGEFIRLKTYGGKLFQNATQAICRDILAAGLIRTHRYGLETVLHVHDENVTDTPEALVEAHSPRLLRAMTDPIDWVPDLPIASGVDVSYRYRKN
jgi:DNA polymerase bacteriophage-type